MKKRLILLTVVILAICLFCGMFTGCGFVGSDDSEGDRSSATNKFCFKKGNGDYYNTNSDTCGLLTFHSISWAGKLGGDEDHSDDVASACGSGFNDTSGVKFIRKIAVFMHNSTFGGEDLDWNGDKDPFCGGEWANFDLSLITLIKDVNTITMNAIALDPTLQVAVGSNNSDLQEIVGAIKGLSCAILMAIWCMGFISQIVNEKFTMETLLKTFMQLLCGIVITLNAELIVSAFAAGGNAIVEGFEGDNPNNAFKGFAESIGSFFCDGILGISMAINFLVSVGIGTIWFDYGSILAILHLIFPLIAVIICAYKIVSQMIMRMLELLLRIIFAPIPLAFSAQQGFSHEAIRYFRGVMACALQPVMMIVGCIMVPTIAGVVALIFKGSALNSVSNTDYNAAANAAAQLTGFLGTIGMTLAYLILSAFLGQVKQLSQDIIAR